jgi:hypothetical protein
LLSACAKRHHHCEQKYRDQLVHAKVLEQSRRVVESHATPGITRIEARKLIKAVETAWMPHRYVTPGLKAGVNGIESRECRGMTVSGLTS